MNLIDKPKTACEASEGENSYHFVDFIKMIASAKGAQREIEDVALIKHARHLVAQNAKIS